MAERNDLLRQAIARLEAATIYNTAVARAQQGPAAPVKENPATEAGTVMPATTVAAPVKSRTTTHVKATADTHTQAVRSALQTLSPRQLTQGIVLAEILGPPASRRVRRGSGRRR